MVTNEQKSVLLKLFEVNQELDFTFYDEEAKSEKEDQLWVYLQAAINFIEREGIVLDFDELDDELLVVMYAGWLYDKRKDPTAQMPRMVRYNLNNKLFSQKAGNE